MAVASLTYYSISLSTVMAEGWIPTVVTLSLLSSVRILDSFNCLKLALFCGQQLFSWQNNERSSIGCGACLRDSWFRVVTAQQKACVTCLIRAGCFCCSLVLSVRPDGPVYFSVPPLSPPAADASVFMSVPSSLLPEPKNCFGLREGTVLFWYS